MIRDRRTAIIVRSFFFAFSLAGLLAHIDIFNLSDNAGKFMYYTIQSNMLALLMFGMLLFRTIKGFVQDGRYGKTGFYARFEMVCVIDLLLTLMVYWLMLAPNIFSMGSDFRLITFDNLSVHFFTPLFCLIDYILFAEPRHLKYRDVYAVVIFPLSYVAFASIAGFNGFVYRFRPDGSPVRFPYYFIDYDQVGAKAFLYISGLVVIFLIFTHLIYICDRKWNKPVFPKEASHISAGAN